jgi:hypothetical protein
MSTRNGRRSVRIRINDGCTVWGQVPALQGMHDGLKFEFRPALPTRVVEYLNCPKPTAQKTMDAMVGLLVEHVVSWEEDGPVSDSALREVFYPVLIQMVDHVCGYSPVDLEKNSPISREALPSH